MVDISANNKRIAKNSLLLYFQMIFVTLINLFSVRLLLKLLGIEDYGIYNVVGGIVTMFSFLSGSMTSGAQRFFAIEIGLNSQKRLSEIFNMTNIAYWIISIIGIVLLETVGLWFLNTQMNFPLEKMAVVNWIYQFSIFAFVVNIISIPYNALIVAHEKMGIYSIMNIADVILKFVSVLVLLIVPFDKLLSYAFCIFITSVLVRIAFQIYCKQNFKECSFNFYWEKDLLKSLVSYSGWNMIGSVASIARNQGVNIVLNMFFGPAINAARAIAMQISSVVNQFIINIYFSTRPQITKYYAIKEIDSMWELIFSSTRFSYYIFMILSIPFYLEIDFILRLWLGDYPDYASIFTRLTLVCFMVEAMTNQLVAALQAANRIKYFQLIASSVLLLNIPVSFALLKLGFSPVSPFIACIAISILYIIPQLIITKKEVNLPIWLYFKKVIFILIIVTIASMIIPFFIHANMDTGFLRFIVVCVFTFISSAVCIWYVGFNNLEKESVLRIVKNRFNRNRK